MVGNIPDVPAALGSFDAVITSMEMMDAGAPGTAQGIPAKQIAVALFKFIIDKLGFKPMLTQLVEILMQFMDAGDLTVEMIQDIPAIQAKLDALSVPGMDGMPMPGMDGIELMKTVREKDDSIPVILMTAFATVETAVGAMKSGAWDYITKPFSGDDLLATVERAVEHAKHS